MTKQVIAAIDTTKYPLPEPYPYQEAAAFFDRAITTLRTAVPTPPGGGKEPPPPAVVPETIETAEDAVLRSLHDLAAEIERIRLPAKDIRSEYEAKNAELAPFQKDIEKIDADIRQKQVEVPTIQAEIGELQRPPAPRTRPLTPKEIQDRRARVTQLTLRLQAIATEIAALEATKQKPETQLRKIANEKAKFSKQLAAAEKPLEKDLEEPLRRQEDLRTKLLQTRLMVAEISFEKSKAYGRPRSRSRSGSITTSPRSTGSSGSASWPGSTRAAAWRSSASGMPRSPPWHRCSRSRRRPASPSRRSASP